MNIAYKTLVCNILLLPLQKLTKNGLPDQIRTF